MVISNSDSSVHWKQTIASTRIWIAIPPNTLNRHSGSALYISHKIGAAEGIPKKADDLTGYLQHRGYLVR